VTREQEKSRKIKLAKQASYLCLSAAIKNIKKCLYHLIKALLLLLGVH
jgi:hypothetical protein